MTFQHREYQQRIHDKATQALIEGVPSVLVESATGSGKSCMGLRLAKWCVDNKHALGMEGKSVCVLWIAHREVLLNQALSENIQLGVNCPDLVVMSAFHRNPASVVSGYDEIVLVVDEAHHVACSTISTILNVLQPRLTIGLTATPLRTDRSELCFGKTIRDASYFALVRDGWLSSYHYYSMAREWTPEGVAATYLASPERWGKSIVFFLSRSECQKCCEILKSAGVDADVVDGSMSDSARREVMEKFETGQTTVLLNAMLLTEGFNCPSLKTVWVRDSSNKGPTTQMGGRVLRPCAETGIKQVVQSMHTNYPFTRVAPAKRQFIENEGVWLDVGQSEEVERVFSSVTEKMASVTVKVPTLISGKIKLDPNRKGSDAYNL